MAKERTRKKVLVLNGPNLNLLGSREPEKYGDVTLEAIECSLRGQAEEAGVDIAFFQSNHEGALVEAIQDARGKADVILFNPAAYTHTSVALRDAIAAVEVPVIEVHLSNVHKRESFRHHSYISGVSVGQVVGFGARGYGLAFQAALDILSNAIPAD